MCNIKTKDQGNAPHSPTSNRNTSVEGLHDVQAEAEFDQMVGKDVEMITKLGIIVDFDGTLSYLAKTPGIEK